MGSLAEDGMADALVDQVAGCLPQASGPLSFYYRPREDELCALVAGRRAPGLGLVAQRRRCR